MKKICSVFLAILMIFPVGLLGVMVADANSVPAITVGTVAGFTDSIVEVPIVISNNPGITALSLDISYDTTKLNLINVIDCEILGTSTSTFGNDLSMVPYTLCWDDLSAEDNDDNGTVAVLMFKVLSYATGEAEISINLNQSSTFNVDLEDVEFNAVDGAVNITTISLSEILIQSYPTKTNYYVGDELDTSGLILAAIYSDGSIETITSGFTISGFDSSVAGSQQVTVSYGDKTTSFNVTVIGIEATGICVSKLPVKTEYCVGDTLDTTGLELAVEYNNGASEVINDGYFCTPEVLNNTGLQEVTVSYENKTTSFFVTVNENDADVLIGDVNEDGKVNTLDRVVLTRYLANWTEYPEGSINKVAADVNCDGKVNTLDRVILTRFIANWDGYTQLPYSTVGAGTYSSDVPEKTFEVYSDNIEASTLSSNINGDANDDYIVDIGDVLVIRRLLAGGWNISADDINRINADVNYDNSIDLKDVVILRRFLSDEWDIDLDSYKPSDPEPDEGTVEVEQFVYGKSVNGRDLVCYSFTPENYSRTILLNFAIHGFEDDYAHDGQVLVNAANQLIEYYRSYEDFNGCRVLIVPCANPDGLYDGTTNNGFGRCNALGIDLNRDFDANYVANTTPGRNYTPYAFSGAESRALRDLFYEYRPEIVCDFHGWLNTTIGDSELAEVFLQEMGLAHQTVFTATNCRGYFANWAHQQDALGLLVEFKNTQFSVEALKSAVNRLISGDFENGTGDYTLDEKYTKFTGGIDCYTISTGRTTTYQDFGVEFDTPSYIDGATDICTVSRIYDNGWVKVTYPLVSGGNKTAFCKLSDFIIEGTEVTHYTSNVSANTKVYRRPDMTETTGSVWTTDTFTVVAEYDNKLQIIYPLDSGGWKMGWISK